MLDVKFKRLSNRGQGQDAIECAPLLVLISFSAV